MIGNTCAVSSEVRQQLDEIQENTATTVSRGMPAAAVGGAVGGGGASRTSTADLYASADTSISSSADVSLNDSLWSNG